MNEPVSSRPLVLIHCEWTRDRELLGHLIQSLGADFRSIEETETVRQLLRADRADLIVADSSGGVGPLSALLALLDSQPEATDLPMVLLANSDELPLLGELTTRRFNAVLLTKPMGREQLAAAIESGLRLRARQRQVQDLLTEVSASNSRLAAANLALEERREEAAEEARRKTRFLSAISHDIRTPVNALVLSCQLLRAIGQSSSPSGSIDARDIDELTGALLTNASSLVELVNDLLDIARHDQGKLEFSETDFPLGDFLTATVEGMRPLAEQKRLALIVDVASPRAILRTDRVKLGRVVQNLVANAIKFTEVGQVRVLARASTEDGLLLLVEDTGIGIPDSMREGIFDEFAQLRNPERDRTKGTGLGLAICRRLVVAMGGMIEVSTLPDQAGSTFQVSLPPSRVALDSDPNPEAGKGAFASHARYRGEVLIVEDHEPSRILLQRLLKQAGLTVRTAENGQAAPDQIEQSRPNLVLMDLMMPVMGGLETLRVLRSKPEHQDLKVIILTGDLGGRTAAEPSIEGASSFLSKPVEVPTLFEMLERFLPASTSASD